MVWNVTHWNDLEDLEYLGNEENWNYGVNWNAWKMDLTIWGQLGNYFGWLG